MDGPGGHYTKGDKSLIERQILYDSIYTRKSKILKLP